jgi:AcrR family transcriptional regulator
MDHVEDKRRAILAATLRLISKNGFHGTAMSRVAQEAGVSTGIISHYFKE